jgi:hypothetical protein
MTMDTAIVCVQLYREYNNIKIPLTMPLCFFSITEGADAAPRRSAFNQSLFLDNE